MLVRYDDWQARLTVALMDNRVAPGDCAIFAANMVLAMTGEDYAAPFRKRYSTITGGIRKLRAAGYRDHISFVEYHFPEIEVIDACPGDILVIDADEGLALGVMQGAAGVYVPTPRGVGLVPRSAAIRAFRI